VKREQGGKTGGEGAGEGKRAGDLMEEAELLKEVSKAFRSLVEEAKRLAGGGEGTPADLEKIAELGRRAAGWNYSHRYPQNQNTADPSRYEWRVDFRGCNPPREERRALLDMGAAGFAFTSPLARLAAAADEIRSLCDPEKPDRMARLMEAATRCAEEAARAGARLNWIADVRLNREDAAAEALPEAVTRLAADMAATRADMAATRADAAAGREAGENAERAAIRAEAAARRRQREDLGYEDLVRTFKDWDKVKDDGTGRTAAEVLENARASGRLLGGMDPDTFENKRFAKWVAWGKPSAADYEERWKKIDRARKRQKKEAGASGKPRKRQVRRK